MTYFDNWNEFLHEARLLYFRNPLKTKYVYKLIKGKGKVILKVTDTRQCCKFRLKTGSGNRLISQFNALFIKWAVSKDLSSAEDLPLKITATKPKQKPKRVGRRRV